MIRILLWNLFALVMVGVAGLWSYALIRATGPHALPWLALTFAAMAGLSWGFYPRRFARWRTVVGWAYTGFGLGVMGGLGSGGAPFWFAALLVVLSGGLLLLLPSMFNTLFWNVALLRLGPDGWSLPAEQSAEEVLTRSPFTLHEITRVTEEVEGGRVQRASRKTERLECRYRGEPVHSADTVADLETWVLRRYRFYRRVRRLPVSPEVLPNREVVREEEQPLQVYASPQWNVPHELSRVQILSSSPFQLGVKFLQDAVTYEVTYRQGDQSDSDASQPDDSGTSQERLYAYALGREYTEFSQADAERQGLVVESVTLRVESTGRILHVYPDLESAETEVLARYRAQRQKEKERKPKQV